jgi:1-acyl-sn-glycerol-3-phosphate acyltransferase
MIFSIVSIWFFFLSILTYPPFFLVSLVIWLLTRLFDRRLRVLQYWTCFWGSFYTWLMPTWKIHPMGREHVKKGATYMVVANHQSQLDVLVNFRLFFHYKILSKSEVFRIPFLGWNMYLNRYVRLVRGDKKSTDDMMAECRQHLDEGSSMFFYPEGTRSRDGNIKEFKQGAFILARDAQVPILPIVITGTRETLPKYSMNTLGAHDIYVKILPEIPYDDFKDLSVDETSDMVRNIMIKELALLREEFPSR